MRDLVAYLPSPIGTIRITVGEEGLTGVTFVDKVRHTARPGDERDVAEPARDAARQLIEYFAGDRREFELRLAPDGTEFEHRVWEDLMTIPFGQTRSYLEVAQRLDNPNAARAVGLANSRNRIAIITPCHRVIGSDGTLTGYAAGLWRKEWLLEHEGTPGQARLMW